MAHLPDVNGAKIFEPEPGIVYSWGKLMKLDLKKKKLREINSTLTKFRC